MKKRIAAIILIALLMIQFYPKFSLATGNMVQYESDYIIYNYESSEQEIIDEISFDLDKDAERINKTLNFSRNQKTNIYIYPNQKIFHRKKYGSLIDVIKVFSNLDWYVGDNVKDNITLVSPLNPGPDHSKESIIGVIPHEYVHTIIYQLNPKTPLWMNEGIALYLTNGKDMASYESDYAPSFEDIQTSNPIKFARVDGYAYAQTYIEYLDITYGFDAILEFINGDLSYEDAFDQSEKKLYDGWIEYLRSKE